MSLSETCADALGGVSVKAQTGEYKVMAKKNKNIFCIE